MLCPWEGWEHTGHSSVPHSWHSGVSRWAGGCAQTLSAPDKLGFVQTVSQRIETFGFPHVLGFHNLIIPGVKGIFLWAVLKPLPGILIRASPFIATFISLFFIPQDFLDLNSHSHLFPSINPFYISHQLYFPPSSFLLVAHNGFEQRQHPFLFCLALL